MGGHDLQRVVPEVEHGDEPGVANGFQTLQGWNVGITHILKKSLSWCSSEVQAEEIGEE